MSSWHFEWFTDWQDIWSSDFTGHWQALLDQADNPHVFATPSLVRAWWHAAQKVYKIDPCFLLATSPDSATVFMPLVIVKHGIKNAGLCILQSAGHAEYDYHDPITHRLTRDHWPNFWEAFESELSTRWRGAFDRAVLGGLRIRPEVDSVEISDNAPYLMIGSFSSVEDLLASLGRSLRGDLRRQLRRLEEVGPVSFRVLQPDETETALTWLPEILVQHAEKWPNSYKLPGFHAALIREALPAGLLHLSELKVGDAVVSRHLGFFYHRRFYWYMPVYDSAYHSYSPGKLHLYFCAEDAIGKEGEIVDLLRGTESYKLQWTDCCALLYSVSIRSSCKMPVVKTWFKETIINGFKKVLRHN